VKSIVILILAVAPAAWGAAMIPNDLKPPVQDGIWLRPATGAPAEPTIGFKQGIRIGLWPAPSGPRGIIRIYTPCVFPGRKRSLINFIAVEPIVSGRRCLSELEHSALDDAAGKRLWFADDVTASPTAALPWNCPKGKLGKIQVNGKDVRTLSIAINVEEFDNGAEPVVLATFREDRPNEVSFKVYSTKTGAAMESCVLTATMGNYSRARLLWLADEVADSRKLWPDHTGAFFFHTPDYPVDRLHTDKDGTLTVAITPNETDLSSAEVTPSWWSFDGLVATQYWRKYPGTVKPPLRARVNGRAVYYGTQTPIPGGVAFENFELIETFAPGVESAFGVTLQTPAQMGWKTEKK
jgi:hypothetical protein